MMDNELKKISNKLSDFDDVTGYLILKDYLIETNLYSKSEKMPSGRRFFDLKYIFVFSVDDMYITKSNQGQLKTPLKVYKDEYVCASHILSDTSMNPDFINSISKDEIEINISKYKNQKKILRNNGFKEVHIKRDFIKKIIDKDLKEELEAIIKYFVYKDINLRALKRSLGAYQKKFDSMTYKSKRKRLMKALETLHGLIIYKETKGN
jgi:hypothetical protein